MTLIIAQHTGTHFKLSADVGLIGGAVKKDSMNKIYIYDNFIIAIAGPHIPQQLIAKYVAKNFDLNKPFIDLFDILVLGNYILDYSKKGDPSSDGVRFILYFNKQAYLYEYGTIYEITGSSPFICIGSGANYAKGILEYNPSADLKQIFHTIHNKIDSDITENYTSISINLLTDETTYTKNFK